MNKPILFELVTIQKFPVVVTVISLRLFIQLTKKLPNLNKNGRQYGLKINECRYFDQTIEPYT